MATERIESTQDELEWVLACDIFENCEIQSINGSFAFIESPDIPTDLNDDDKMEFLNKVPRIFTSNAIDKLWILINKDSIVIKRGMNNSIKSKNYRDAVASQEIENARAAEVEGNAANITIPATGYDISELGVAVVPTPDIENGETMVFVSSSVDDNPLGDGAREIIIKYLDPISRSFESITLPTDGTTPTVIPVDIAFVSDFFVSKNGIIDEEFTTALGDITIYRQSDPTRIYTVIKAGGNKSFTCSRIIPEDSDFYLTEYTVTGDSKGASVRFRSNVSDDGDITDGFLFKIPLTVTDSGIPQRVEPPIRLRGGSRFKVTAFSPSGPVNSADVSVFINGWLEPAKV